MRQKWVKRLCIVIYGATCGIGFHLLKIDLGGDYFWSIRLPISLALGMLLFYVVDSASALRFLLGKHNSEVQTADLKTYLPLFLIPFFPLQKMVGNILSSRISFLQWAFLCAVLVLVSKCLLVLRMKERNAGADDGAANLSAPNVFPRFAAIAGVVALFWFHQLTLTFDDYFPFLRFSKPSSFYFSQDDETRKIFLYEKEIRLEKNLLPGASWAVTGCKITKGLEDAPHSRVPIRFVARATDDNGKLLAERLVTLDAADKESRGWKDIELDLSGARGGVVHFVLRARPHLLKTDWRYLSGFLLHNPLDFSYFQESAVQVAWSEPEIVSHDDELPNIILISLDTLRADRLGCYGYEKDVSPVIDSFAHESILFENAFSQATWTLPSHLSIFTGKFSGEIGIEDYSNRNAAANTSALAWITDPVLPEILGESGFLSVGFTQGGYMSPNFGLYKGFYSYTSFDLIRSADVGGHSIKAAREWIDDNRGRRFFVFIHTFIIHNYELGIEPRSEGEPLSQEEMDKLLSTARRLWPEIKGLEAFSGSEKPAGLQDFYDLRIRITDSHLRDFFSFLQETNLYDDALIIVTSDHGESFGEYHDDGKINISRHSKVPYESQIRVPLIMKLPSASSPGPRKIHRDVSLLDILPTTLALLGLRTNPGLRGHDLLAASDAAGESAPPLIFSESNFGASVRGNGGKYIRRPDGREEYYDLLNDPDETQNLAHLSSEKMIYLRDRYNEITSGLRQTTIIVEELRKSAPPEIREQLKALGYIE